MAEYLYVDPSGRRYKITADTLAQADLIVGEFFGERQQQTEQPVVDPNTPLGAHAAPLEGFDHAMLTNYVRDHPDQVVEFLTQLATTGVGMGAGAPLGPGGVALGGAAGNVAGRGMAHDINRWLGFIPQDAPGPEIASIQTLVDAGVGATGGLTAQFAKPGARWLTGIRGAGLDDSQRVEMLHRIATNPDILGRLASASRAQAAHQLQSPSLAGLVAGGLTGHLPTALVAGASIWGGRQLAASTLLRNETFVRWALLNGDTISTTAQLATALAALAAEKNLEPDDRNFFAMAAAEFEHADPTIAREEFRALEGEPRFTGPSNRQEHIIRLGGRSGLTPYVASRANGRFLRRASQEDIDNLMD